MSGWKSEEKGKNASDFVPELNAFLSSETRQREKEKQRIALNNTKTSPDLNHKIAREEQKNLLNSSLLSFLSIHSPNVHFRVEKAKLEN